MVSLYRYERWKLYLFVEHKFTIVLHWERGNKGIITADSPNPGEFPPDRTKEATRTSRTSRETVLQ